MGDITKENIFDAVYFSVWRIVEPHFTQFLLRSFEPSKKHRFSVRIPFKLNEVWLVEWDEQLSKQTEHQSLADAVSLSQNEEKKKSAVTEEGLESMDSLRAMT